MREPSAQSHIRRRVSTLLIVVGAVLLGGSGASVARAAIARDAARTRWAELEAQRAATGARAMMAGGTSWAVAPGSPVRGSSFLGSASTKSSSKALAMTR
jgi:hypothetical protein